MSHFTRVKTQITDLDVLKRSLADLEYACAEGAVVRGYQGKQEKAELVVRPGGDYDIGFVREADGAYALIADWWGVHQAIGLKEPAFIGPVMQRYAYHKVLDTVRDQGFQLVQETHGKDATLKLTVRRWA